VISGEGYFNRHLGSGDFLPCSIVLSEARFTATGKAVWVEDAGYSRCKFFLLHGGWHYQFNQFHHQKIENKALAEWLTQCLTY